MPLTPCPFSLAHRVTVLNIFNFHPACPLLYSWLENSTDRGTCPWGHKESDTTERPCKEEHQSHNFIRRKSRGYQAFRFHKHPQHILIWTLITFSFCQVRTMTIYCCHKFMKEGALWEAHHLEIRGFQCSGFSLSKTPLHQPSFSASDLGP